MYLWKVGRILAVRAQKVQKHVGNRRLVVARVQNGHVLLERRRLGEAERLLGLQRLMIRKADRIMTKFQNGEKQQDCECDGCS